MRTLQEIVIGSSVFLVIDRVSRLASACIVKEGEDAVHKTSLHLELMILALVIIIAWKVL